VVLSRHQNAAQNHNLLIVNKSLNACYHSVQSLLSSRLLSKNLKIEVYKATVLPVVLYGCETYSLILTEEHRLRVYENRVLRKIFGSRGR
jgi:hypothetical protein